MKFILALPDFGRELAFSPSWSCRSVLDGRGIYSHFPDPKWYRVVPFGLLIILVDPLFFLPLSFVAGRRKGRVDSNRWLEALTFNLQAAVMVLAVPVLTIWPPWIHGMFHLFTRPPLPPLWLRRQPRVRGPARQKEALWIPQVRG